MTCLIVWLFQSHRQNIDFTSRILWRWRKLAKSIFSMRIWIVKKFSIFFNWSCNLKRFLSTKSIWIKEHEERIFNSFLFSTIHVKAIHFFFSLIVEANRIVIESHWIRSKCEANYYRRCLFIDQLLCDLFMLQRVRNDFMHSSLSKSLFNLLVIDLHFLRMMFDMSAIRMRYLIWICNWFKCKSMKTTCVSIFKIEIEIIRNNSKMFCKQRFYIIASLLIIFDFLFLSMCQTNTL
jgi:hypothetical protein